MTEVGTLSLGTMGDVVLPGLTGPTGSLYRVDGASLSIGLTGPLSLPG